MLLSTLRKNLFPSNYPQIFYFNSCSAAFEFLGLRDSCYIPEYTSKGSVSSQSESPSCLPVDGW